MFWLGIGALLLLALYRYPGRLPYRDGFLIAFVFLVTGAALEIYHRPSRQADPLSAHNQRHTNTIYTLEGSVADAPVFAPDIDYMTVRLKAARVWAAGQPTALGGRVVVRWSDPRQALHPGDRIRVEGRLDPVISEVNIGVRGVEDYYRTLGYHSTLRIRGHQLQKLASPVFGIRYWASRLRQWEAEIFAQTAPLDIQPFIRAVWLGDRNNLSDAAYQPYLQSGAAHILAVSGVHVGIVYLSLHLLLRTFVHNRKRRTLIIMGAVMLFALIAGGRTPIFRATLMLSLYLCAELLEREPDAPTALSIAAVLFLVFNPGLIRDTGFVLSFCSLASILVFSNALAERMTAVPIALRQNIAATLGVSVLPLPLGAHFFHVIPLIGPLCNLIVIPLLTAVLWLCMLVVLVAPVSIQAASLFGHALAPIVHGITWVVEFAAGLPWSHVTVTSPTLLACACYAVAALGLWRLLRGAPHPRRWAAATAAALLLTWACWRPLSQPATLDFLDVGHGDATFVRTPGGSTLLIDAGNKSDYVNLGSRVVVPWLLANGVDALDYVVVTHPDQDHIGGIPAVLEMIDVGEVLIWPVPTADPTESALIEQCRTLNIPLRRVTAGETIPVDPPRMQGETGGRGSNGATITVLHPAADTTLTGINNQSVVLRVSWPGVSALLTGDIEIEAEHELLDRIGPMDILKTPHHGSHTSSSATFLDITAPQLAVVSTRQSGRRDAVGPGVIPRYEERGIRVYRTDYLGGIRIRQRGGELAVESARGLRGYSLDPAAPGQ